MIKSFFPDKPFLPVFSQKTFLFAIHANGDMKEHDCLESCLVCDFDFRDSEILQTRENPFPVQPCVVGANVPSDIDTSRVCIAIIPNNHITKTWTVEGIAGDSPSPGCCVDSSE
jgi:hypothetical protein